MIFPVKKLLADRGKPLCVYQTETVRDALVKMIANEYSQLPILDDDDRLVGVISERVITRTMHFVDEQTSVLSLPVTDCQEDATVINADSDVTEALDILQNKAVLFIVEQEKPIGIITDYDSTHFFRDLYEGLLLVQDIELMLRQLIESVLNQPEVMNQALINAVGSDKKDPSQPRKQFNQFTFGNYVYFVIDEENWTLFEKMFKPQPMFFQYMEQVRVIRNQLAHFRGKLDDVDYKLLYQVRTWLENRPRPVKRPPIETVAIETSMPLDTTDTSQHLLSPLNRWLQAQAKQIEVEQNIQQSFADIEAIIGTALPSLAKKHRVWWENEPINNPQSKTWLAAGWEVDEVDFNSGAVTFRRTDDAIYNAFFANVLENINKKRPTLTRATTVNLSFSFGTGKSGFGGWAHSSKKDGKLHITVYINRGDAETNMKAYNLLKSQSEAIEKDIGYPIEWDPRPKDKSTDFSVTPIELNFDQPPQELDKLVDNAANIIIAFVDAVKPRIKELDV